MIGENGAIQGGSARKGYLFCACSFGKGREIGPFSVLKPRVAKVHLRLKEIAKSKYFNPLSHMSDKNLISPYTIPT